MEQNEETALRREESIYIIFAFCNLPIFDYLCNDQAKE